MVQPKLCCSDAVQGGSGSDLLAAFDSDCMDYDQDGLLVLLSHGCYHHLLSAMTSTRGQWYECTYVGCQIPTLGLFCNSVC